MLKKFIFITLFLATNLLAQQSNGQRAAFGLNVNGDDLEVEGKISLATRTRNLRYRNFFVDANFISSNDNTLMGFGLYVENSPIGYSHLKFGIGLRSIFAEMDKDDSYIAVPITMFARARMYIGGLPQSHIKVKFSYAPDPLSFSDASSYTEYRIEADIQAIDNVEIYLGYRGIDTNYKRTEDDIEFNSAVYFGFRFVF